MRAVPCAAKFTFVVDPPRTGTFNGAPASLTKFTGNETGEPVRFVKYSAEYQPPPNANCGRTLGATGAADGTAELEKDAVRVSSDRYEPVVVFGCAAARTSNRQPERSIQATTCLWFWVNMKSLLGVGEFLFSWQGDPVSKERTGIHSCSSQYSMLGSAPLPVTKPFRDQIGTRSPDSSRLGDRYGPIGGRRLMILGVSGAGFPSFPAGFCLF